MGDLSAVRTIDCVDKSTNEINCFFRRTAADGAGSVEILEPQARHNLAVAITDPIHFVFRGHVGYYAVSLCDRVTAEIHGSAGWGVGDNLMDGEVVVHGNAASSAAPSLRGGRVVVKGSAGPRSGIGQKWGDLIIGGDAGYMTGFMMQSGRIIVCGDTASSIGDSMYDGEIYVGGSIREIGNGVKVSDPSADELDEIGMLLDSYGIPMPAGFKKLECDGTLHHFDKKEFEAWKEVL